MRRRGSIFAVVAVLVVAVGLGMVLHREGSPPGTGGESRLSADGPRNRQQPTPEPGEATAVGEAGEPSSSPAGGAASSSGSRGTAGSGHLTLSEPDPGAPVGPQPIPDSENAPVRVRIPAIGVDSSLEHLARDRHGVLQPPVVPEQAGWFAGGTVPGERGPAVIAGHVDSGVAGAVFRDLEELRPGAEILVEMSDGEVHTFRMDRADVVRQAQFPSAEVYGPVPDRQLRLITCHTFDPAGRDYVDNLVIFATAPAP